MTIAAADISVPYFRLADSVVSTKSANDPVDLVPAPVAWNPSDDDAFPATMAKGDVYYNPVYKTLISRVSDGAIDRGGAYTGIIYPPYSRAQLYNCDGTMFACVQENGYWIIYDAATYAAVRFMDSSPWPAGDQCELHWHPTDPSKVRYMPYQGLGFVMRERDVITNVVTTLFDLRSVVSIAGHPGATSILTVFPTATRFWNHGEGRCSADCNIYGFLVEANTVPVGMITYNLAENRIIGCLPASAWGGSRWDHASVTPSGRYYVPSGDTPGVGTRAYTIDLSEFVTLHHKSEHSDLGAMPNGNDFYYSCSFQDNEGRFFWTDIDELFTNPAAINATSQLGQRWQTGFMYVYNGGGANPVNPPGTGFHVSARCTGLPGWAIVSTYCSTGLRGWSNGQVFAVEMADDPRIFQIAHPNNNYPGGAYFAEMFTTVNIQGTRILVASNWGAGAGLEQSRQQTYEITIPAGSIPPHRDA